jgi:hypothetical protein
METDALLNILLIIGVLNFILFWKIWGMTVNVKLINNDLSLLTRVIMWKSDLELHKPKGLNSKVEVRTFDGETIGHL